MFYPIRKFVNFVNGKQFKMPIKVGGTINNVEPEADFSELFTLIIFFLLLKL